MLSRSQFSRFQALQRRRGRDESGEFLVEGVRLVEDLLESPVVPVTALLAPSLEDTPRGRRLAQRLLDAGFATAVTDAELARICTTDTPQGVAVIARIPRASLTDLDIGANTLLLVLDAVQDPGNFGTVVRCADAFGATAVLTLPGTVDPWNPKSVRSAAGSSLRVPVIATSAAELERSIRARGGSILGASMEGIDVAAVARAARRPVALVLGNEGAGIGTDARRICDELVSVPIRGAAESLNVGVAAGILVYVLTRSGEQHA
jgi:RNA methyltransferase, TrmH family